MSTILAHICALFKLMHKYVYAGQWFNFMWYPIHLRQIHKLLLSISKAHKVDHIRPHKHDSIVKGDSIPTFKLHRRTRHNQTFMWLKKLYYRNHGEKRKFEGPLEFFFILLDAFAWSAGPPLGILSSCIVLLLSVL